MIRGCPISRCHILVTLVVSSVWLFLAFGQTKTIRNQLSDPPNTYALKPAHTFHNQTNITQINSKDVLEPPFHSMGSRRKQRRTAFVTMVATDSFVPGVLVLWYSLNQTRSIHSEKDDFVVLETSSLSEEARQRLETSIPGCILLRHQVLERIDRFSSSEFIDRYQGNRSWMMFSKLNVFDLVQYERVLYMDADLLVLRDISALLHPKAAASNTMEEEKEEVDKDAERIGTEMATHFYNGSASLVACPEKKGLEPEFNAGFLLLRPSHDLYLDLKSHVNDTDYLCGFRATDQSFLCHYFHAARHPSESRMQLGSGNLGNGTSLGWEALPRSFMALYKVIKQKKKKPSSLWAQAYLLHFNGNKPWLLNEKDRPAMKDRMTRRWLDMAKECGERCYFQNFLNGAKISSFLSLYNY